MNTLSPLRVAKKLAPTLALCAALVTGCGFNTVVAEDEQVKAAWAEGQGQ